MIRENPVVDEVPAESIGDYHDDALGFDTCFGLSYIGGKAMDRGDGASWDLGMDMAAEAIGARSRHVEEVIAGQLSGSDWSEGDEYKRNLKEAIERRR